MFFFASQISIECRKVTSKPRPCALLPGWSRSVSFQPCSWSFTLFLNTLETWRTLHECKADVRVAVLSLTKHVFVVMSQPHRSLKPHLVSHVNSVLGGGPLRSFQDLHHLRRIHGENFGNLVSGHTHHTSRAADFQWEDVFGTWDAHGCAGKMVSSTEVSSISRIPKWMDTAQACHFCHSCHFALGPPLLIDSVATRGPTNWTGRVETWYVFLHVFTLQHKCPTASMLLCRNNPEIHSAQKEMM